MKSKEPKAFDVIIVGAGVIGAAIARELSRYKVKIAILETNLQVAQETSAGNSGVIHGGFDPDPGTLHAKLNILGRKIYESEWFKELAFPHKKVDSMVLAFDDGEVEEIRNLYEQGITNGVKASDLKILSKKQCLKLEPNLNPDVVAALLCTCSHVVDPVALTYCLVENAMANGVKLFLGTKVESISRSSEGFAVKALTYDRKRVTYRTRFVVNAAGHYADVVANMINDKDFTLKARRGQYRIIEKSERGTIDDHILFMAPTIHGKGVIVAPMLDGHLLVGPTAEEGIAKEDTRLVTVEKYDEIGIIGRKIIPNLRLEKTCSVISGSRSICVETDDFVIAPSSKDKRFINVAGISSPGLSAAPAIAREVISFIKDQTKLARKAKFIKKQAEGAPMLTEA
jgi:glycerol-3-phosphate dehydrogenase